MRFFKREKWKTIGRRLAALAVVCGFALSMVPVTEVSGAQIKEGKETLYKYTRLKTVSELVDYVGTNQWTNILMAWEDDDGKVYYSEKYDKAEDRHINYGVGQSAWFEIISKKDRYFGNHGFGDPDVDSFYSLSKVDSYINVKYTGKRNSDNKIQDTGEKAPIFQFQLVANDGKTPYIQAYSVKSDDIKMHGKIIKDDTSKWYVTHEKYQGENCFRMGVDISGEIDWQMTHNDNMLDSSSTGVISDYEKYFRFYACEEVEVDAYLQDIVVKSGESLRINDRFLLPENVKITVQDGGFLIIEENFFNNGKIILQKGGTMIMNKGSTVRSVCSHEWHAGSILVDGGNLLVLEGAMLLIDSESGELKVREGGSVVNRGTIIATELDIDVYGIVHNDEMGKIYLKKYLHVPDMGTDTLTEEELFNRLRDRTSEIKNEKFSDSYTFDVWICDYGQLVNYGEIYAPFGKNKFVTAGRGKNTVAENRGEGKIIGSFVEVCCLTTLSDKKEMMAVYYCNGYPDEHTIWQPKNIRDYKNTYSVTDPDKYGVYVVRPRN